MEATRSDQAATAPDLAKPSAAGRRGVGQLWPFRVSGEAAHHSAQAIFVEELEMELELLREENARLKIERHRSPDAGAVIERVRRLSSEPGDGTPLAAGSFEVMTECLLMREGLLDACREIGRAMEEMQHRLSNLSVGSRAGSVETSVGQAIDGTPPGPQPRKHLITAPSEGQAHNGRTHNAA
jgi:hypothetical protein